MAHLLPPQGTRPVSIVLTKEEALTALATLTANATYANREIRDVLTKYVERLKKWPGGDEAA